MKAVKVIGFILYFLAICANGNMYSQEIKAFAQLDTSVIRIGEHVKLSIFLTYESGSKTKISWPQLTDTLRKEVEIISASNIKKTEVQKNLIQEELELKITSFDSGYWAISPFIFILNNDSSQKIETQALLLQVNTVQVDTAETSLKDIKPTFDEPLSWKDYLPEIISGIAVVAILILLWFVIKRIWRKKIPVETKPKISIPAHEIALKELELIRNKKMWQEGRMKEYYTAISDTLRIYIENRFGIHAMELTSDEIMQVMKSQVIDSISKEKLEAVLRLSDFVKFAKANPIDVENELTLSNAVEFVKGTMREEKIKIEQIENNA